jgi:hypothetical protein
MHLLYLYYLLQVSCRVVAEREAAALLRTIAAWCLLLPILREREREREIERERERERSVVVSQKPQKTARR